jgi:hypothetical protein
MQTKTCTKCKLSKSIDDFYRNKALKNILFSRCKKCSNKIKVARRKVYRATEIGRIRLSEQARVQNSRRHLPTRKYALAKAIAKARQQEFNLNESEYITSQSTLCHYCDDTLPKGGIGLDRVDNNQGYINGNVLPCCTFCNIARSNNFSVSEMENFLGPAIKAIREQRRALVH